MIGGDAEEVRPLSEKYPREFGGQRRYTDTGLAKQQNPLPAVQQLFGKLTTNGLTLNCPALNGIRP